MPAARTLMTDPEHSSPRPSTRRLPRARRMLLLPTLLCLLGLAERPAPTEFEVPMDMTMFSFDRADESYWNVVNDGVMGGRSAGFVAVEQGTLRFTGTLVTQGGGFTSIRARRDIDLTGQIGIELRVRGSGRQFEVEVDDGLRTYGRTVSRRAPFPTTAEWTLVRVPFSTLRSTVFGQAVNAPPIDLAKIRSLGLYMADGRDGPFTLEVDSIRAYGAGE
jgi:NADH dehydrogenase [ubiquinone] 1 alpha subcomplex assembly factor 1